MAYSGTVAFAHGGTLGAGTVDTINFSTGFYSVAVHNLGATDIYFRPNVFGGTADPTAGADDTYVVRGNTTAPTVLRFSSQVTAVKVVSSGAMVYRVEAR